MNVFNIFFPFMKYWYHGTTQNLHAQVEVLDLHKIPPSKENGIYDGVYHTHTHDKNSSCDLD
jgi:hypothetical protein